MIIESKSKLISAIIILFLSFAMTGCKKSEDEKNYWPQGLNGKFVFSASNSMVTGYPPHNYYYTTYYTMDASGMKQLLRDPYVNLTGVMWFPDGSKVLIYGSPAEFYSINADGTGLAKTEGEYPNFSPDGTKVAFVHEIYIPGATIGDSVCTVNADGSGLLHLYFMDRFFGPYLSLSEWSPTGDNLAIVKYQFVNNSNFESDSVGYINSTGTTLLAKGDNPHWSTDGSELCFYHENAIWSISLTDHTIRKLADLPEFTYSYYWSPDNTRIAYPGSYADTSIYIIKLDGSAPVKVSDRPIQNLNICWSPDGNKIIYAVGPREFTVINADGSGTMTFSIGQEALDQYHTGVDCFDWH